MRGVSSLDAFSCYPLARSCSACLVRQPIDQRRRITVPFVLSDPSSQTPTPLADIEQTVSRMLFHSYVFEWHGLYHHPLLVSKEIDVLALNLFGKKLHQKLSRLLAFASVSTGVKIYLQFHMLFFFS